MANDLAALPTPKANGVTNKDSVPNLNLFISFLVASSLPLKLSSLFKLVGPSNMSPNVPISSVSTTKPSPAAPPVTAKANLLYLDLLFKSFTLFKPFLKSVGSGVLPFAPN